MTIVTVPMRSCNACDSPPGSVTKIDFGSVAVTLCDGCKGEMIGKILIHAAKEQSS